MDKEYLKEKIAFFKLLLTTAFAFLAGCIAWLFNNILVLKSNLIYFDAGAILLLAGVIQALGFETMKNIENLED